MPGKKIKKVADMNIKKVEESTGNINSSEITGETDKNIEECPGLNSTTQYASDLDEGELVREPGN